MVGGRCALLGRAIGQASRRHQPIMMTPMTVVAIMILSALSLDSWMPRMLTRQK